ncbi:hypothetical protein [Piscinibacter sp.]|uniref:PIN-like domain-containing protein n=1 Tax=Piscinibacter sp. TaxID=1903157 RepID=UPI00391F9CD8
MNFLFDNNLPADLAHAISALSRTEPDVQTLAHLSDMFPPATADLVWINKLSTRGTDWYIVSIDKFKKSHGAEREALRRAGHTVRVGPTVVGPSVLAEECPDGSVVAGSAAACKAHAGRCASNPLETLVRREVHEPLTHSVCDQGYIRFSYLLAACRRDVVSDTGARRAPLPGQRHLAL